MEGLKDKLFVGNRVTDICKIICGLLNLLAIIMYRERAFLERLELFFELYGTVIFVVREKRGNRDP